MQLEQYLKETLAYMAIWPFRNDGQFFVTDKFRHKPSSNEMNKNAISISQYLSCLEERLLDTDISFGRNDNHTNGENNTLHNL